MRKSFTWFLSLLVFLFVFAVNGIAQEEQETVELYAEDASGCYSQADDYTVTISVRDFIQLTRFDLDLQYDDDVFGFEGATDEHASLAAGISVSESAGVINIAWSGSATTIGDDVKTSVLVLHFSVNGFPGNTASSFTSDMEWTTADFWYTTSVPAEDAVNTVKDTDGSLTVSVGITGIETALTAESCAGGDVDLTVTAPPASMYLFNEDVNPDNWIWTTSATYQVAAGDAVTVRVKDANGCISLKEIVNVPETVEPVAFTVDTQDPACYGGKGSVVISATGGTAPYTYYISPNEDGSNATTKVNFQFSMEPGDYYVSVQDANECAEMVWEPISIVDENTPLVVTTDVTNVLCYGESTGEIEASNGGGDVTMVSINGVVWHAVPYVFEDLAADTYTIWGKNDNGCTVKETVEVTGPDAGITFAIEIDDTSCGDDTPDGAITVVDVAGGTAPYEYSLDGENWTSDAAFTELAPTYYSLWVRDANLCTVAYDNPNGTENTIAVQSPDDIRFDVVVTHPVCADGDAMVTIANAAGGTGDLEYSFDGGSTWVDTLTAPWVYPYASMDVMVQNVAGDACAVTKVVTSEDVDNPDALAVATYDLLPPTCPEGNDGNVTLQITGGVAPYYYSVNGSSWKMTDDEFTHVRLNVGTHEILVKDDNGCEYDSPISVTVELDAKAFTATKDGQINCFGDEAGMIDFTFTSWPGGLSAGVPNRDVQYFVEGTVYDGTALAFQAFDPTTETFKAGLYTVTVIDQYTCETTDTVLITQNPELIITDVVANGASCFESFEGSITIYATGGSTVPLEYAVVNNEGALDNLEESDWLPFDTYNDEVYPPLSTVTFNVDKGNYYIAVRDECAEVKYDENPIEVSGYEELLVDEEEVDYTDPKCYGSYDGTITVPMSAVTGGAGAYLFTLLESNDYLPDGVAKLKSKGISIEWTPVEGYVKLSTGEFKGLPAGVYAVLVEDAEDCPSYTTEPIVLEDPSELTFSTEYLHMSCENMNDGLITIVAYGGTPDYWYAINNKNTWVGFGAGKDTKTYIATEPGTFTIWVKDANDCVTDSIEVTILEPTALSAEITVTDPSCYGGTDGEISVVGMGGWEEMTTYEFKVGANGTWTSSTVITGLNASVGNDTLFVRDVNYYSGNYQQLDCVYEVLFTVGQPDPITYDVVITDVKCKDGADGTLTVTVMSGGTPWYSDDDDDTNDGYNIKLTGDAYDSGWMRSGLDNVYTFENLAHSHYTVYIEDANGCTLASTTGDSESPWTTIESWEVAEPDTYLGFEATWLNDVTCYNGEDGSFKVVATGGTAPYKYFAGLSIPPNGGGHVLVPAPDADSDEWMDDDTLTVSAGTWVVWVMDSNGCIIGGETDDMNQPVNEWRVKVMQPDSIMWDFHTVGSPAVVHYVQPTCWGASNGQIHLVDITGGSGVYNAHVWGMSAAGEEVDSIYSDIQSEEGLYILGGVPASDSTGFFVTVMDENGCTSKEDTIFVGQPLELKVELMESPDNYSCFGAVEGWIETMVDGGTEPYQYQLLKNGVVHTPWQDLASAFLVQVGNTFTVQVKDAKGCEAEAELWMPTPLKVEYTYEDMTCSGVEKPTVKIIASGTPGRQFKVFYKQIEDQPVDAPYIEYDGWFDESIVISDVFDFDNENYTDLHYAVYVEDDHGCPSLVDTLTFDQVQVPITVTYAAGEATECSQDVMVTSIIGGVAPYVVMVNDSVIALNETYTMARGENIVKIMDAHMCTWEEVFDVVGNYVTRDTTIETYIGEKTQFVDEAAALDTMLAVGTYEFVYTVDCERTLNVTVVEVPREYAIKDVQGEGDESPVKGEIAKITGTVTGVAAGEGFFVQDASEAWSGIWVEYASVTDDGIEVGDGVEVVGTVDEVAFVTTILASDVMVTEEAVEIMAIEVAPSDVEAEMYESVMTTVLGARATAVDEGNGEWTIFYEPTDDAVINDWLYSSTPIAGDFYNVTGIVNGRNDKFSIEPRMESDVVNVSETGVTPGQSISFKVYPNPFNDKIYIDNNDKLTRLIVTNIAGQRVIDVEYPEREIRTANLVSGVYLVNLFTESGLAKTERIVKR
ncbi:MAG: T9SS type A sorting domain-containing protein [Draconibacterium sp.]